MSIKQDLYTLASKAAQVLRVRTAYRKVLKEDDKYSQIVITDLRRFCPTDPTLLGAIKDEKQIFINIGRRQVLSRIQKMLNISDEKINAIAEAELKENYNGEHPYRW